MESKYNESNYTQGSEGSRECSSNIRKYPTVPDIDEHAPSDSEHPVFPPDHNLRQPTELERGRRQAARNRDNARRFAVINSPLGVEDRKSPAKK